MLRPLRPAAWARPATRRPNADAGSPSACNATGSIALLSMQSQASPVRAVKVS
ncbi:hypothetical protein [Micromonospora sp. NPDC047074]|uniref:hypothetical protein n=1 Tax=Micromonospora sp. NPDC047074 TaxID=3154339 RepID=UPI0033E0894B